MKKYIILLVGFIWACESNEPEIDQIYPEVAVISPVSCQVFERGKSYTFSATFTDNQELGSYSFDFHDNFNHHSHGTSEENCTLDPIKKSENPFELVKIGTIPSGLKEYKAADTFEIPNNVDTGDYHFTVNLTDKAGWSTIKRISVKIK